MTISERYLIEYDEEMKNTRKMLERVPDGRFDYKPHPKSMELGRLASHVAELPSWAKMTLETEELDIAGDFKPWIATNREELLKRFDESSREAREKIAATPDSEWLKTWTLRMGSRQIMALPRVGVMRGVVMNHLIHHRAQLSVYLRLNDVEVPGMYGPSADEMKFWEAQAS